MRSMRGLKSAECSFLRWSVDSDGLRGACPGRATTGGRAARRCRLPGSILASIDTTAAPGYQLVLAESVFEPGAYVTSHVHPTAIVVCVQSGALGFALQHGSAIVTRSAPAGTPSVTEPLVPGTEITLQPRECVSFDHFAEHTAHTGWNASDGQTVLIEARLVKTGEPFTTFIDAQGTPVAP